MPLYGTRDIAPLIAQAPHMPNFATEPWQLPGAGLLQLVFEIREAAIVSLLPTSLHPTIPPTLVVVVSDVPESPVGPFTLAEVRIGCRAAARPRGFVARCYVTTTAAAEALRTRWGYPAVVADVRLKRGYDRHSATVVVDGEMALDCALINPEPIGVGDVQYLPSLNLARVARDGGEVPRIVQVDPDYVMAKADRGKAQLTTFDASAWLLDGADPWWPVSATLVTADMTLPQIRYVIDPSKRAIEGVERVG